jgi:hypothetical protein
MVRDYRPKDAAGDQGFVLYRYLYPNKTISQSTAYELTKKRLADRPRLIGSAVRFVFMFIIFVILGRSIISITKSGKKAGQTNK